MICVVQGVLFPVTHMQGPQSLPPSTDVNDVCLLSGKMYAVFMLEQVTSRVNVRWEYPIVLTNDEYKMEKCGEREVGVKSPVYDL